MKSYEFNRSTFETNFLRTGTETTFGAVCNIKGVLIFGYVSGNLNLSRQHKKIAFICTKFVKSKLFSLDSSGNGLECFSLYSVDFL